MFLRCHRRKKDGKEHRYYSIEESRRLQSGRVVQRRVLYLGEINDSQQAAWRKTLEVFDEQQQRSTTLSLFAEDRPAIGEGAESDVRWDKCDNGGTSSGESEVGSASGTSIALKSCSASSAVIFPSAIISKINKRSFSPFMDGLLLIAKAIGWLPAH